MTSKLISMKRMLLTIGIAIAVAIVASAATAATTGSGITGVVQLKNPTVTCRDDGWSNSTNGTVNGPIVYAAALKNGSTSQYVKYSADVYDFTTQTYYTGGYTNWQLATTTTPAHLPDIAWSVPFMHRAGIRIHIIWWDPRAQSYSGTLDYTINAYWDASYGIDGNSTTWC